MRASKSALPILLGSLVLSGCGDGNHKLGNNNNEIVTEVCDNLVDDNGDGRIDCDDPWCASRPICHVSVCGDGIIEDDEDCDGNHLGGASCESLGYLEGVLMCTPECTFEELGCRDARCNNGTVEPGEQCDTDNLDGATCVSLGFGGGELICTSFCVLDPSNCINCGNGQCDSDESPFSCAEDCGDPLTFTAIGTPAWEPAGVAVFSAECGSQSAGFPLATDVVHCALSFPEHALDLTYSLYAPGTPHDPPYDAEMTEGASACGHTLSDTFPATALQGEQCLFTLYTLVPTASAVIGTSPDFASGPILPHALFPIVIDGDLYRDGAPVDPYWDSSYNSLADIGRPEQGYSHVPIVFYEHESWLPAGPLDGDYEFRVSMIDASGSGWDIRIWYQLQ